MKFRDRVKWLRRGWLVVGPSALRFSKSRTLQVPGTNSLRYDMKAAYPIGHHWHMSRINSFIVMFEGYDERPRMGEVAMLVKDGAPEWQALRKVARVDRYRVFRYVMRLGGLPQRLTWLVGIKREDRRIARECVQRNCQPSQLPWATLFNIDPNS